MLRVNLRSPRSILVTITFLSSLGLGYTSQAIARILTEIYAVNDFDFPDDEDQCINFKIDQRPDECQKGSDQVSNRETETWITLKLVRLLLNSDAYFQAQRMTSLFTMVQQILILITSPILGYMADNLGRRKILVASLFLSILPGIFLYLALSDYMWLDIYFVCYSLTGLICTIPISLTCAADISQPTTRAGVFGSILAAILLGYTVGPKLSNPLSDDAKALVSIGLQAVAAFQAFFFFEETNPETKTDAADKTVCEVFLKSIADLKILNRNSLFRNLSFCVLFSFIVQESTFQLQIYYLQDNFDFSEDTISNLFLVLGVVSFFLQGILLEKLVKMFGEKNVLLVSWLFGVAYCVGYAFSTNEILIFISSGLNAVTYLCFPTVSAIKSNNASSSEQGAVQGAIYSVRSLAAAVGPVLFTRINESALSDMLDGSVLTNVNSACWLVGAVLYLMSFGFTVFIPGKQANSNNIGNDRNVSGDEVGRKNSVSVDLGSSLLV